MKWMLEKVKSINKNDANEKYSEQLQMINRLIIPQINK